MLIKTIENQDNNLTLTRLAQKYFPSLKVRCARDMGHIIALRQIRHGGSRAGDF